MDFLLGVPGKLKTLTDRLSATWAANVARRKPVTSIINYYSSGGVNGSFGYNTGLADRVANVKSVSSGSLTADVLSTVIDRTGAGAVFFLAAAVMDTTSRTIRIKVTVDGTVVFDATSSAITTLNTGMQVVGCGLYYSSTQFFARPGYLEYDTSFKVEIASSLTETDKIRTYSNEQTRA